eukprot:5115052-Lingulodinium_polyedra.AAC.1
MGLPPTRGPKRDHRSNRLPTAPGRPQNAPVPNRPRPRARCRRAPGEPPTSPGGRVRARIPVDHPLRCPRYQ